MAGYVSTMGGWKAFERESNKLFKREKIEVFHAKDFFHEAGEFRGWDEPRKMRFATEWFEIAGEYVFDGATISIDKAAYNKVRGQRKATANVAPYTYYLNILIDRLCGDGDTWDLISEGPAFADLREGQRPRWRIEDRIRKHKVAQQAGGAPRLCNGCAKAEQQGASASRLSGILFVAAGRESSARHA